MSETRDLTGPLLKMRVSPIFTRGKSILALLMERTVMEGECWVWNGSRDKHGYGIIPLNGKKEFTHRLSHLVFHQEWDGSECVLHHCDNPPCWSPKHLFNGTQLENIADMHRKNRGKLPPALPGESNPRALLTWEKVRAIRKLFSSGVSISDICAQFEIPRYTLGFIVRQQTWREPQ